MPRAYSRMAGLWAIFTMTMTGCWISPDASLWQSRTDSDMASGDGPLKDGPAADHKDSGSDQTPDVKPAPVPLSCTTPTKVGNNPVANTAETALRVNGTELLGKTSSWRVTKRPAADQPFGSWSSTSLLTASKQDPTFFTKGVELAVVATSPGSGQPRLLELCTLEPLSCAPLPVQFKTDGTIVTDDMDGPSVAVLSDGTVLMAHNIDIGGTDIYLARALDPNSLSKGFETSPVTGINQPGIKEDDPALSPDGLVLVYGSPGPAGDYEIWVSERTSATAAFPPGRLLTDVNSTADDSSGYLAPLPPSGTKIRYELYFTSDRDGTRVVYRSECSR